MWLSVEGFREQVKIWWDSYKVTGSPSCVLAKKMKFLKEDLKRWNREVFGHLETKKAKALAVIEEVGELEVRGLMGGPDELRREEARVEYIKIARMEETCVRQISRCLWLKEGDCNTEFFHKMTKAHRDRKSVV